MSIDGCSRKVVFTELAKVELCRGLEIADQRNCNVGLIRNISLVYLQLLVHQHGAVGRKESGIGSLE